MGKKNKFFIFDVFHNRSERVKMTSDIKIKYFFEISVIELSIKVFSTLVTLQNYINYRNRKKPIFQKFENKKKRVF